MTVTDVTADREAGTLTFTTEYPATVEAVWALWADPRLLERWWGPPTYPATVVDHDLTPSGVIRYYMTSPEGERMHGWWRVSSADAPRGLAFVDGFGEEPDSASEEFPASSTEVTISDVGGGRTRMVILSRWSTVEEMDRLVAMGMQEGMTLALGQTDALVAAHASA